MKILYHKNFLKNYKKRITPNHQLSIKFKSQLEKFVENSFDPTLRNHKLIGRMSEYWSFSVTGDIRVIYKVVDKEVLLFDIGSHNQVYWFLQSPINILEVVSYIKLSNLGRDGET